MLFARECTVRCTPGNNALLEQAGSAPMKQGMRLADLISRPAITFYTFSDAIPELKEILAQLPGDRAQEIVEAAEILIKYQGYIERERQVADKLHRLDAIKIAGRFDYEAISALSTEARQKLAKIQPQTIAQAARIPGVSPSDVNILLLLLGR